MSECPELAQAIVQLNQPTVLGLVKKKLSEGMSAPDIIDQCQQGMMEIGQKFDAGECFIPELIMAGKIMEQVMTALEPYLKEAAAPFRGSCKVVMGTVQNDIHDIGKDIVVMMLRGAGFEVIDLGVNVSPRKFVEAVQENQPAVVGLSVLLTTCYQSITDTLEALKTAGLRNRVSIMLGGAAATDMLAEKTGCDYFGKTAMDAVTHSTLIAQSM